MLTIAIAQEFTDIPGARHRKDGPKSGQEFLEEVLNPKFEQALKSGEKLLVDMDGAYGYATSFISQSFGQLSHKYGAEVVLGVLEVKYDEDPLIKQYTLDTIKKPDREF